jgi:uncharacterized tellurite resistance protein B-like protein
MTSTATVLSANAFAVLRAFERQMDPGPVAHRAIIAQHSGLDAAALDAAIAECVAAGRMTVDGYYLTRDAFEIKRPANLGGQARATFKRGRSRR